MRGWGKLGDPTTKIVEFEEKLELDMIVMDPKEIIEKHQRCRPCK